MNRTDISNRQAMIDTFTRTYITLRLASEGRTAREVDPVELQGMISELDGYRGMHAAMIARDPEMAAYTFFYGNDGR